jgi:hypothetical protein
VAVYAWSEENPMSVDIDHVASIGFLIRHGFVAVALALILAMDFEGLEIGWWHLKRFTGKTAPEDQRPLRIWTAPFPRRKPGQ